MTKGAQGRLFTRTTRFGTNEGKQAVFYHDTPVVTWDSNSITLRTGGYKTVFTKMKINQTARDFHLGFVLYQEDFEWYVVLKAERDVQPEVIGSLEYDWDEPIRWDDPEFRDLHLER